VLQLKNDSPFKSTLYILPDEHGVDTLYVVVKGTFRFGSTLVPAERQVPPTAADQYWGEPGASSLKYASEAHLRKPGTDVVLVGNAWSQGRTQYLDVAVSVAERRKTIRVFGDRTWRRSGRASPPEPFESLPLVFERAYGGVQVDPRSGRVAAEERNPVGVGFCAKRQVDFAGKPLPNLEDPERPIRSPGAQSIPACFGFVAPSWLPRRRFAGTYDEAWQKSRAPYLPNDFDLRFLNAAHPDLVFDRFLEGGEPVEVLNASRKGPVRFLLPACAFEIKVRIAGTIQGTSPSLETVLIEPDEERVCLSWRSALPCDKRTLRVEEVSVQLSEMQTRG
jgi:hypothetical protein